MQKLSIHFLYIFSICFINFYCSQTTKPQDINTII